MSSHEQFLDKILYCINKLKVFKPSEFDEIIAELKSLLSKAEVDPEQLCELICAFITERCDNLLANISLERTDLRSLIHDIAKDALELYIYCRVKREAFNKQPVWFVNSINREFTVKARDEKELIKELIKRGVITKGVDPELKALLNHIVIDNAEEFKGLCRYIENALSQGVISIMVVPRAFQLLFFKEYYQGAEDLRKVQSVAQALHEVLVCLKDYMVQDQDLKTKIESLTHKLMKLIESTNSNEHTEPKKLDPNPKKSKLDRENMYKNAWT